ncbi:hypothetical protein N7G274_008285 [Stereocaulon virgatum]|uniref:Rhodopsin domain-containing protein n=1 Tax=Stereocaulon virgatum TaxID=373712 RepID=A0ABR3ZZ89_9LECA
MSTYQNPQFQGLSKEELAQSEAHGIYSSIAIVTVIATTGVVLRFLSRRKSKAGLSYDDYTIIAALSFSYGLNISIILDTALYGLGRHLPAVKPTQLPNFQKTILVISIFYFTTSATTKASLILLSTGIIVSYYISLFFTTIFQCVPVAAFWDHTIKNPKCVDLSAFSLGSGIANLLTDVMVLCLPMPMVWSLHTNRTHKLILTGIFLLGFFVCAVSMVRLAISITTIASKSQGKGFDSTWNSRDIIVWSSVEQSVGVLSACLPTLRPLLGDFLSLSSRTAMTVKTGSGVKKPVVATDSTIRPVSPRRDWDFKRLDEEAALVGQPQVQKGPVSEHASWIGSNAGLRTYEMDGFNNQRLPKSSSNKKSTRWQKW